MGFVASRRPDDTADCSPHRVFGVKHLSEVVALLAKPELFTPTVPTAATAPSAAAQAAMPDFRDVPRSRWAIS